MWRGHLIDQPRLVPQLNLSACNAVQNVQWHIWHIDVKRKLKHPTYWNSKYQLFWEPERNDVPSSLFWGRSSPISWVATKTRHQRNRRAASKAPGSKSMRPCCLVLWKSVGVETTDLSKWGLGFHLDWYWWIRIHSKSPGHVSMLSQTLRLHCPIPRQKFIPSPLSHPLFVCLNLSRSPP